MYVNVYHIFYSLNSHQGVSTTIPTIFRVMSLLHEHKGAIVFRCVAVTPQELKIIIISVHII